MYSKLIAIKKYFYILEILILFQMINSISSKLDNIIRLGNKYFRFIHFSSNLEGDMIVDTSAYPEVDTIYKERRFFGLKKNGRFYFKDDNNEETPFASIFIDKFKPYSESCFIQLSNTENNKEYLLSISSKSNYYVELYDLEKLDSSIILMDEYIGEIGISERSVLFKSSLKSTINYNICGFVTSDSEDNYFYLIKNYLESPNLPDEIEKRVTIAKLPTTNKYMISCFETTLNRIICLYLNNGIVIYIYDLSTEDSYTDDLFGGTIDNDIRLFFKGVLLKEEVCFFLFYIYNCTSSPYISIKEYNSESHRMENYNSFGLLTLSRIQSNPDISLNDMMKINENKMCICLLSSDKDILYIIIIYLFDNDSKLMINYYYINIFELNKISIYLDLRLFLYNDYISFGFSHCIDATSCYLDSHIHYSSLIIFSYPNGTDYDLNLIEYLYQENYDIDELNISLSNNIYIENNIFGYTISGIKINNISENLNLYFRRNNTAILKDNIISTEDIIKISLSDKSTIGITYSIEYAAIVKEPDLLDYLKYINYTEYINLQSIDEEYYSQKEYVGKSVYYNIIINKEITTSKCALDHCSLCYDGLIDNCVICNNGYYFSGYEYKCIINGEEEDEKNNNLLTTIISNKIATLPVKSSTSEIATIPKDNINTIEDSTILNKITTFSEDITTIPNKLTTTIPKENTIISNKIPTTQIEITTIPNKLITTTPNEITTISNKITTTQIEITTIPNKISTFQTQDKIITEVTNTINEISTIPKEISIIQNEISSNFAQDTRIIGDVTNIPNTINSSTKINISSNKIITTNLNEKSNSEKEITIPIIKSIISEKKCSYDDILKNNCNLKITNEQIKEVYSHLKGEISEGKFNQTIYKIIQTENAIFHISTIREQQSSKYINLNISSIDFGECEKKIKEEYHIIEEEDLIILKTDIYSDYSSAIYVQYEIYHPYTLEYIPLDICKDLSVNINIPIYLNETVESLYLSLKNNGYNLFNSSDLFYNDICSTYTTQNGTDITLLDRKNLIYDTNKNIFLCQGGCEFVLYNNSIKKSKCNCQVQNKSTTTDTNEIEFDSKEFIDNFLLSSLKNSNFKVVKCYKLIFSLNGQLKNIGSYILLSIILLLIISMICYCISGNKKLNNFIQLIIRQNFINNNSSDNLLYKKKTNGKYKTTMNNEINKKIFKINKKNKDKTNNKHNKHNIYKKRKKDNFPPKKNLKKLKTNNEKNLKNLKYNLSLDGFNKIESLDNILNNKNNNTIISNSNINNNNLKKNHKEKYNRKNTNNYSNNIKIYHNSNFNNNINNNKNINNNITNKGITSLNDEEMNSLEYYKALIYDKRTFFQYYISLFFFNDQTMHKITVDHGKFDIIFQIPQILYSFIISMIISKILKILSLSSSQLLSIKKEKNLKNATEKGKKVLNRPKIKFVIFYILSFLLCVFFWYFISCFCAVYKNTQNILIKNTLIAFAFSMLYPFALNLIPGMFRIQALRAVKKDKKCLYKISIVLSLI